MKKQKMTLEIEHIYKNKFQSLLKYHPIGTVHNDSEFILYKKLMDPYIIFLINKDLKEMNVIEKIYTPMMKSNSFGLKLKSF